MADPGLGEHTTTIDGSSGASPSASAGHLAEADASRPTPAGYLTLAEVSVEVVWSQQQQRLRWFNARFASSSEFDDPMNKPPLTVVQPTGSQALLESRDPIKKHLLTVVQPTGNFVAEPDVAVVVNNVPSSSPYLSTVC
ncbi:hypothetical protein HKX48_008902, partial [Thoreauomyces humboldtii]